MAGVDLPAPTNWQDLVPAPLLKWPFLSTLWVPLAPLVVPVALLSWPKRQKLMPNVPVVGLEDQNADIKDLRLKFRHGSKNVLLEGYRKVKVCDLFCRIYS
jgi:hypothetical protein